MALTWRWVLTGLLAAGLYWGSVARLEGVTRSDMELGTLVKLPLFIDVALAGGDGYMAANIGAVRAMTASVDEQSQQGAGLKVLAEVEMDVSRLNPGHEDNYYVAVASLVGTAEHKSGMWILRRAIDARPYDFIPPFFYAVYRMHYDKEILDGAKWMRLAAARSSDERNAMALEKTAARWVQRGSDPLMAAKVLDAMASEARHGSLRDYIAKRATQARQLAELQEAAQHYGEKTGKPPSTLDALVASGFLSALPADPVGMGYELDKKGVPAIRANKPRR